VAYVTLYKRILILLYESVLLFAISMVTAGPVTVMFKIIYDGNLSIIQQPKYLALLVFVFTVFFCYFYFCWTRGGQTLAMKAWRCKVVNIDGGTITSRQAVIRYLSAMLSWLLLGAGFLLSLFRDDRATLHDLLSKSYLVKSTKNNEVV